LEIFPVVKLLTHTHGFNFSKLAFLPTLVFMYSSASNFHIRQCRGPALQVCGTRPIKLTAMWLFPYRAIKGKSQKSLERYI